ncbi:MAG: hypothetical protein ACE5HN_03710 [Nitrospiria bacterium]
MTEVPFTELVRALGVYVIWDGRAKARPTYIGEGNILKRIAVEHSKRFALPFDGYVSILGDEGYRAAKREAELIEALLLHASAHTDRYPSCNVAPGKLVTLERLFRQHGTVRVRVTGCDPLGIPWSSGKLPKAKVMQVEDHHGKMVLRHNWRLRRLQG